MTLSPELYRNAKAWPFVEAVALLDRIGGKLPDKGYVLFETGYGPSGLPHIGTFGEVARTTMVRRAFEAMTGFPTKLICFSDDMDGLRKVPENLPNADMIAANIGKPLTSIPDPFGTHESFGHHMNARLRAFLDEFGFEYEFKSSTATYKAGEFDQALLTILKNYDKVMQVMLPTLGEERASTYSPFLPVSPRSGKVLLAPVISHDAAKGTITYQEEDGSHETVPVTGGHCKLQWKPDMGMRWAALDVDYEMYGKDHLVSAKLYDAICKIAGGKPPQQMMFELFLDEKGEKISKSKGNGLTIDEWLRYAPTESLAYYMFQKPRTAKRLYFDVIPQAVDEYQAHLEKYNELSASSFQLPGSGNEKPDSSKLTAGSLLENPAYHIHRGQPPASEANIRFSLLLNIAAACNPTDKSVLWGFISRYNPQANPATCPMLDKLAGYAVNYYNDFVKPAKNYRAPTEQERSALRDLSTYLTSAPDTASAEELQTEVYEIGKRHAFTDLKLWFKALYEILLGQPTGPRMGSFIALYGKKETIDLIAKALGGELSKAA